MQNGLTHYAPSRGLIDLRCAASTKLRRDNFVSYDPEAELLIIHGGIHAYYLAMQSLFNPGDEVLIPDPSYATHSNMAIMLRGNVIRVPAPAENGFIPLFEILGKGVDIEDARDRVKLSIQSNRGISDARIFAKVT